MTQMQIHRIYIGPLLIDPVPVSLIMLNKYKVAKVGGFIVILPSFLKVNNLAWSYSIDIGVKYIGKVEYNLKSWGIS